MPPAGRSESSRNVGWHPQDPRHRHGERAKYALRESRVYSARRPTAAMGCHLVMRRQKHDMHRS